MVDHVVFYSFTDGHLGCFYLWVVMGFFLISIFFFFFRATPVAHGGFRIESELRLGVKLELQLPAYPTTTATRDPSQVCDLHHSSRQRQILNPRSEARDGTRILMVPSWIRFCCATTGTPPFG